MDKSFYTCIPNTIAPVYMTEQSKANNVAILGSSKTTNDILKHMNICFNSVKQMILNGKNIVTGCCVFGIMGAAYVMEKEFSAKEKIF